ncbi:MAG: VanZ family protein, partial [Chromatiales bacterium]
KAGLILVAVGWFLVFVLTLYPTPEDAVTAATSMWCLVCGEMGLVDVALNVILFVPLGIGLGLLGVSRSRGIAAVVLTTFTIEVLQLSVVIGRDASLSDLITNSIGGGIGYLLGRHWRQVFFTSPRISLWLAAVGVAGWVLVQGFTGWALQRTLPRSVYYGQWAPVLGQFEPFTGTVVSARLDRMPLPGTRLPSSAAVREALLAPQSVLEVRALTGTPTADLAPIFSIFDDRQREIVLLGQNGIDLVYRLRTRSGALRLRSPALRLTGVLPTEPGARVELRARYTPGRYHLEAEIGDKSFSQDLALSVSWGWTFLLPFDHAFGAEMLWLTTLWIAGLLFPVGYYAARSQAVSGRTAAATLVILLFIGLAIIPALSHLDLVHPIEWIAGIAGAVIGFRLGKGSAPDLLGSR